MSGNTSPAPHDASPTTRVGEIVALVVAALLQLVVGFFTWSSGLVAPLWAIALLGLLWVAAVVVLVRLARRRPLATPAVPVVNGLLWWGLLTAGERLLGWTA
ncbi:hypothetical protein [Egicoccus sp. AB-alg2]|uniref:hypothetical protein n=1 Tax=Egicoccus sp. AB-alg2 TaxID=3242693 RepID=UPI00359E9819